MSQNFNDLSYDMLIDRILAWRALENGSYSDRKSSRIQTIEWGYLSENQKEAQIKKTVSDFKLYFYCPDCGRKFLIKDAIVKRKVLSMSHKLNTAAAPGWFKFQTSGEICNIRLCKECAKKRNKIRILIALICCVLPALIFPFIFPQYCIQALLLSIFGGYLISTFINNFINSKLHPHEFIRAYDGNALDSKRSK